MAYWQKGIPAVSTFGWTVSREQAAIIRQVAQVVIWLPDRNRRKDAAQHANLLAEVCRVMMPEFASDDPEALTDAQIRSLACGPQIRCNPARR